MKRDIKILTIKKIKKMGRGQLRIEFKQQAESPYTTREKGVYEEGMRVKLHKGRLIPIKE